MQYELDPRAKRLNALMPHRVREVLLVSSHYDAFILEEDGYLTERIWTQYKELNLTSSPRVTHVSTGEEAIRAMEWRRFDLVITMTRLADMDVLNFGRRVKELRPRRPVVLLAMDEAEMRGINRRDIEGAIDGVFLWTGDANILLAVIKLIEDRENVDHDILAAGVRVILVVEDTVRHYTKFLPVLYNAILAQAQSLITEVLNDAQRIHRLRARPKVLLTHDWESAVDLINLYRNNLAAVISDIRYPRGGVVDPDAGYLLCQHIRKILPDVPVLLQSADPLKKEQAARLGFQFVHKYSKNLLRDIEGFLSFNLGFGDFVFRTPDGRDVARVSDIQEMVHTVPHVDERALLFHAEHNHISTWLMARCEFELARKVRRKRFADFANVDEMREWLVDALRSRRFDANIGIISEFDGVTYTVDSPFTRVGEGSIGGKARGVAFLNFLLLRTRLPKQFPEMGIHVPQTLVLCTGIFDQFLDENGLRHLDWDAMRDEDIARRFLYARLPDGIRRQMREVLSQLRFPLAVRSSSLLEDSAAQPFAGVYATYMLPNNHPDIETCLAELCVAIRLVYASTFFANARGYIDRTPHRIEEEKMAVMIQRLVGKEHGPDGAAFYPSIAGVAQSLNHYPVGHQKAEDGVALVALGLGRIVVEGGETLRFSPVTPEIMPQLSSPTAALKNTQKTFWTLAMHRERADLMQGEDSTLERLTLKDAEDHGTLKLVGSVYCPEDDRIRDGLNHAGPRLVTLSHVLKAGVIPLAPALDKILGVCRKGMGRDVQIEFAVDMGDWGAPRRRGRERAKPRLYALQLRPLGLGGEKILADMHEVPNEELLVRTTHCLGTGIITDIEDVVYVDNAAFDPKFTREMAKQIGEINDRLVAENRPYLLIGPGRWGSSDSWLGIPVQWSQIRGAKVIVEASPEGYHVDPSQGSHFFQNITSLRIGYLTVPPGDRAAFVDWAWLDGFEPKSKTQYLRHVRLERPLEIQLDGSTPRALVAKTAPEVDD